MTPTPSPSLVIKTSRLGEAVRRVSQGILEDFKARCEEDPSAYAAVLTIVAATVLTQ